MYHVSYVLMLFASSFAFWGFRLIFPSFLLLKVLKLNSFAAISWCSVYTTWPCVEADAL